MQLWEFQPEDLEYYTNNLVIFPRSAYIELKWFKIKDNYDREEAWKYFSKLIKYKDKPKAVFF